MTIRTALHEDDYSQKSISIGMKADIYQDNYANSLEMSPYAIHKIDNFTPRLFDEVKSEELKKSRESI